jgi:hypothetical protein
MQSPKRCVLKYKQGGGLDKSRTMDNVQKHNICTNVSSSQTVRSYLHYSTTVLTFEMAQSELIAVSLIFLTSVVGGGVQTGSIRHVGHLLAYFTCPG